MLANHEDFAAASTGGEPDNALAWYFVAFAIFNTYMLHRRHARHGAVFAVFLTLEITEILLAIGYFKLSHGGTPWMLHAGAGPASSRQAWPGTHRRRAS